MSTVAVYSYTHSVVYVTDNILRSLKDIIVKSGLNPEKLTGEWAVLHRGIKAWIESKELEYVTLEIYNPADNSLITRWDVTVAYSWSSDAGNFWTDTDQLKYAIKKAGIVPAAATYSVMVKNKPGWTAVDGWGTGSFRSTDGFVRQSLGTTVEHNGLGAATSYWRKTG
jgi:hypothetical protein